MRCTQIVGLNNEAQKFLDDNVAKKPVFICPSCGHESEEKVVDSVEYADEKHEGMFDDGPMLRRYILTNGRIVREVIHSVIWSSGPCIFIDLVYDDNNDNDADNVIHGWTQKLVDECI